MTQLDLYRRTQADRILSLLKSSEWVDLPTILDLRVANYRARISELRKKGFRIECVITYVKYQDGTSAHRTRYKLLGEPA